MKTAARFVLFFLFWSPLAQASKARMASVGPAVGIPDDVQQLFTNPVKLFTTQDQLNVEFAVAAEGGYFVADEDSKFGVYYGHRNPYYDKLVADAGIGLLPEQNPLEIFYGQKSEHDAWALSIWGSKSENKVSAAKVEANGLRAGYKRGEFEIHGQVGGASRSKIESLVTAQLESAYRFGGEYRIDNLSYTVDLETSTAKVTPDGGADALRSFSAINLGFELIDENTDAYFFYGAKVVNTQTKQDPAADVVLQLPFYFGMESKMGDGLQLRGYLQQSILLNQRKADPGTGAPATIETEGINDIQVAFGASYQWGRLRVDGSLSAGSTGVLRTDNLLSQTGLTYLF